MWAYLSHSTHHSWHRNLSGWFLCFPKPDSSVYSAILRLSPIAWNSLELNVTHGRTTVQKRSKFLVANNRNSLYQSYSKGNWLDKCQGLTESVVRTTRIILIDQSVGTPRCFRGLGSRKHWQSDPAERLSVTQMPYCCIFKKQDLPLTHVLETFGGSYQLEEYNAMPIPQARRDTSTGFCSGMWPLVLFKPIHHRTSPKRQIEMPIKRGDRMPSGKKTSKSPPQISQEKFKRAMEKAETISVYENQK